VRKYHKNETRDMDEDFREEESESVVLLLAKHFF
jgi:hypothetical protein